MPPEEPSGMPEEDFSRLLESISTMAPLVRGVLGSSPQKGDRSPAARGREGLLLALKPYLSPSRCAAVDYFIRLDRISELLRATLS